MTRRLAVLAAAISAGLLGAACRYGDDSVVPPPPWWTGGDAGVDTATPARDAALVDGAELDARSDADPDARADVTDAADAPQVTGDAAPCGPVINEIMMHGATGDDEFVELYNSCSTPVVFDATWTITTPTNGGFGQTNVVFLDGQTLPAGGYLIFVGNGYSGAPKADGLLSDGTDQLASSGGAVALFQGDVRVDAVGWGALSRTDFLEGSTTVAPPPNGRSIGRHPNGFDTNANAQDFATDLAPTPRAVNP